jgi:hypothetical protein
LWIDACLLAKHKTNPKAIEKKITNKETPSNLKWMEFEKNKTNLTIGIVVWKSFQLSHIYTKQKKGGSTNLKS